jgi:hypothetical protein
MARFQASEREARYHRAREFGLPPVVTEGDSWFSYELYLNFIDRIDDTHRFALKRLESSGDTIAHMVGSSPSSSGIRSLRKVVQKERPILLFFSGGGNDIVGPEMRGAVLPFHPQRKAANYLDTDGWRALIDSLRTSFAALVGEIGPLCPIFAHGYDYFVPSDRAVKIFPGVPGPGPWVFPEMTSIGIVDPALQRDIARAMIDDFNDNVLGALEEAQSGFFAHADLRDTLDPDTDWQNEIHPTRDGFRKVAARFLAIVDEKLADVRTARAERLGGMIA